jgi:hypothetical protein
MKNLPKEASSETVRATISLPLRVKIWATEMCEEKGYDNFSAYVAELIRRDKGIHPIREAA